MAFLIQSKTLEQLKPKFDQAKQIIAAAIDTNRPIIIRHHADCDGYAAGIAIEMVLMAKIGRLQSRRNIGRYIQRSPSRAPYYDIGDSIRDSMQALQSSNRFGKSLPLILILDNGSSPEDLLGIRHGKAFGLEYIVIDHHPQAEDVITPEVLVHINPAFLGDTSFCAGMLAAELAGMIQPHTDQVYLAALAGIADRAQNPAYLEKSGIPESDFRHVVSVLNFMLSSMPGDVSEYVLKLFRPGPEQRDVVETFTPYVRKLEGRALAIAKKSAAHESIGSETFTTLDIGTTFPYSQYPKSGRIVGLLHDTITGPAVTIGHTSDSIIIRANDASGFALHTFLAGLQKEEPDAFAEGGGHEHAGTVRFSPPQKERVMAYLKKYISQYAGDGS